MNDLATPVSRPPVAPPSNPGLAPAGATLIEDALAGPFDVDAAVARLRRLQDFFKRVMVGPVYDEHGRIVHDGQDYGPPFPGSKTVTLLRAGADKLCQFYGVYQRPRCVTRVEQWGLAAGERQFFHFEFETDLVSLRTGQVVAVGLGSCNSREVKYRYRKADRVCPDCQQPTIFKSKNADRDGQKGWFCWAAKGGCGAQFKAADERITKQETGKVENTEIADLHHTIMRIAKKRAAVDAVVTITRAAGFLVEAGHDEDDDHDDGQDRRADADTGGTGPNTKGIAEPVCSEAERGALHKAMTESGHKWADVVSYVRAQWDVDLSRQALPKRHFDDLLKRLGDATPLLDA